MSKNTVRHEYKRRYLLALSEGKTEKQAIAEVAHDQGVDYRSVTRALLRAGIKRGPTPRRITPEERALIAKLYRKREWCKNMAKALKLPSLTVVRIASVMRRTTHPDLPYGRADKYGITMKRVQARAV